MSTTGDIARFAADTQFRDLPVEVVQETKRLILDTLGCAIGGLKTEKGKLAIQLARALGGPPESTLFGTGERVSVASSAFALGELMNALDYEALLSPPDHATPYVLAAPLAFGEKKKVKGKELIVAAAIAHEISTRIASGLVFGNRFAVELPKKCIVMSLPTPGYGLCVFGGVAAAGRILGLDAGKIGRAMGIAGYAAPVPMLPSFAHAVPASMPKYLSAGTVAHQEVLAALSAQLGATGDAQVLDGNYSFWRAFGCDGWRQEMVTEGLGERWVFTERLFYKPFPCCGAMQNSLALFQELLIENALGPQDIETINVKLNPLVELPVWRAPFPQNHIDAQFNVPYVFSVLTHKIEPGPAWQTAETLENPEIRRFMKKLRVFTDLEDEARGRPDIEIVASSGGHKRTYTKQGFALAGAHTDDALISKFIRNTSFFLGENRVRDIVSTIMDMEELPDTAELMRKITSPEPLRAPASTKMNH